MFAHELATLNEYKEENRELKSSCQALREREESLRERNTTLENTVQGTTIALDSLIKAIKVALPSDVFDNIIKRAKEIAGVPVTLMEPPVDRKPNKRNRPLQVVQ
jgi:hypothetical protein